MLTVTDLSEEMGLSLVAGHSAACAPIRWVHITELADPTPWLSGGELVLTTGMALRTDGELREYVRCLAAHDLAGLGFGTGFDHASLPAALVDEARSLAFPLFEVPYELPFIALTEKAFIRLVNDGYEALQRSVEIHKRLERIVLEERGLDELVRALATTVDASVAVLDSSGAVLA
ncbi:MAG: PucR family transcriptional regulator ligand-binding domain-containing protein, partial [Actinomycetota bacterium]|nr:PucR family transcriptional regulator ligand-binding domain-containing protein [Actinomycetota bacterium]